MKDRRTAHRVGIAQMVLCMIGLTAWALFSGCSLPACPPSKSSWTLIFDGNGSDGGVVPAGKKYAAGALVRLPYAGTLTKTGLTFKGWNTKANGSGQGYQAETPYTMGTPPITFYAQWATGYALTYDGNGSDSGEVPPVKQYTAGSVLWIKYADTLTRTDHIFTGWNRKANGKGEDYQAGAPYRMGAFPFTFYAQWTKVYAVTFDGNGSDGGTVPQDHTKYVKGAMLLLPYVRTLSKTGYAFTGWNTKADGSGTSYRAGGPYTMGGGAAIFYAQWAKKYAVTFDGNGSDGGVVPTGRGDAAGAFVALPGAGTLTKTDHIFTGWNTKADGSGTTYSAGMYYGMGAFPITFYAQWKRN